jgi:hypothetical protein
VLQNDFLRWQKLFFDSLGMQQQYSLQELRLETQNQGPIQKWLYIENGRYSDSLTG